MVLLYFSQVFNVSVTKPIGIFTWVLDLLLILVSSWWNGWSSDFVLFRYVRARDVRARQVPSVATGVAVGSDILDYCAHVWQAVAVAWVLQGCQCCSAGAAAHHVQLRCADRRVLLKSSGRHRLSRLPWSLEILLLIHLVILLLALLNLQFSDLAVLEHFLFERIRHRSNREMGMTQLCRRRCLLFGLRLSLHDLVHFIIWTSLSKMHRIWWVFARTCGSGCAINLDILVRILIRCC